MDQWLLANQPTNQPPTNQTSDWLIMLLGAARPARHTTSPPRRSRSVVGQLQHCPPQSLTGVNHGSYGHWWLLMVDDVYSMMVKWWLTLMMVDDVGKMMLNVGHIVRVNLQAAWWPSSMFSLVHSWALGSYAAGVYHRVRNPRADGHAIPECNGRISGNRPWWKDSIFQCLEGPEMQT